MALNTSQPKSLVLHRFIAMHRSIPRLHTTVIGPGSFQFNARNHKVPNYETNSNKLKLQTNLFSLLDKKQNRTVPIVANAASTEALEPAQNAASTEALEPAQGSQKYRRILLSDVVVKRERNVFFGRKWSSLDRVNAGVVLAMHVLSLFAPFQFNWSAFWVAVALYVVTGLFGVSLSYHRHLSHRSFKLPKWLEYLFAYCGVLSLQGDPIGWVNTHRYHHQFCDSDRDPHSPTEGFWFSHLGWNFDTEYLMEKCGGLSNVGDLEKQSFYRFIRSTYILHPLALGAPLYAMGGFPFLVWGMGVRIVWVYHVTWLVNSVCHIWGKQAWNTRDLSRNNGLMALLSFGDGWHNNHHAFEYSARHGLEWWQIDMTWYTVRLLQTIGLATDVKLPSEIQKQRMAFENALAA